MQEPKDIMVLLKEKRVAIDKLIQEVKIVAQSTFESKGKGGAEMTLSFRALQQAKHWLGEALGENGSSLPKEFADKAE